MPIKIKKTRKKRKSRNTRKTRNTRNTRKSRKKRNTRNTRKTKIFLKQKGGSKMAAAGGGAAAPPPPVAAEPAAATVNKSLFEDWIYVLPKDSFIEHFKNRRSMEENAEQFFCYFRNPESIECPWGKSRCLPFSDNPNALSETVACKHIKYKTNKDLKLLAIPYKVTAIEEITKQDINLAKNLLSLTKNNCYRTAILKLILNDDSEAIDQVKYLIDDPDFNYRFDYCEETRTLNHDYNLYRFMCELKQEGWDFDGWVRVINNTETEDIVNHIRSTPELTHEMDEITLCNPIEDKLVITSSTDYTFIPISG